jgi:hypothetical protein
MFEIAAAVQLKFSIRNLVSKKLKEQFDTEKPVFSLNGLSVRIRKGHTCSRTWYLHFFRNMENSMKKITELENLRNEEYEKEKEKEKENEDEDFDKDDIYRNKSNYYLPAIKSKNIFLFEKTEEKKIKSYMEKFSFLQYLPLEIDIVGTYSRTYVLCSADYCAYFCTSIFHFFLLFLDVIILIIF